MRVVKQASLGTKGSHQFRPGGDDAHSLSMLTVLGSIEDVGPRAILSFLRLGRTGVTITLVVAPLVGDSLLAV